MSWIIIHLYETSLTLFLGLTCNNVSHQSDKEFIKPKLKFYANQADKLLVAYPTYTLTAYANWLFNGWAIIGDKLFVIMCRSLARI